MRMHSIRTRIFGGFAALILLQAVVGVSVWRADNRVKAANAADAVAAAAFERITTVRANLSLLQLALAEFVRTGLASDRQVVDVALATIGKSLAEVGSGEDTTGQLALSINNVRGALETAVTASVARRDKEAALIQAGKGVEAGFASLAQASTKSPERDTVEAISALGAEATHALVALQRYASTGDMTEGQTSQASTATLKDGLEGIQKSAVGMTPRLIRMIRTVTGSLDELPSATDAFGNAWAARSASLVRMQEAAVKARAVIAETQATLVARRGAGQAEIASARGGVRATVLTAGIASALIGIGLAFLVGLSITRPIGRLASAMRRIAGGALNIDVPEQLRRDEIGGMAAAVQVFKDNGLKAVALEEEVTAAHAAAELDRARIDAEQAREVAEDQVAITALAHGLAALANGNLTYQITEDIAPKTRQLKDDFNATAARLRETMTTIAGAIQGMSNGTGEISQAADDLSRRTEQQAATLEQTAAALDQITATVRKTAEGATHAQAVVSTAKTDAEQSSGVVRDAVLAMNEIKNSSEKVSQIIGVIDEIAFQTNLLALNAGVEAARAGDAGRGFAVVASEVRALAQRSAQAAKEIKQLISSSSNQVGQGVRLVNKTGESLQRIVGHVTEVYLAITDIAAAAKEQASGLHEVNVAVNQMDQVTQQNAAMVEQSTAASHNLARETTELSRLTGYFQVGSSKIAAFHTPATPSTRVPKPVALKVVARTGRHPAVAST